MADVTLKQIVQAPISKVWSAWDDFGNIYLFNPNLNGSHLIGDGPDTGVGAMRQCDLNDGKNYIREKIIDYVPERRLVIDIYEGTLPLKSAKATFLLKPLGANKTEVLMRMDFEPKFGLLGKLMVPLMRPQFKRLLSKLLQGNADYVEHGTRVQIAA